jgi:phosphoglycolate phosphatase
VKAYYHRLGFDFEAERYDEVAREYIEIYYKRQFECKLQDDTIATLQWCREKGVSQSILSAYNQQLLAEAVEFFELDHFFVTLAGLDNHYAHSKVEAGKGLLRKLGLSGERVLLVGDTTHDYETAKAIGTDCVLVGRGHHRHKRLAACGVSVLNSLSAVPKLLF